jgi:uncharacterized protein (UPF0216 family)
MLNERVLEKFFQTMNAHIPAKRPSLASLLESSDPSYSGRDERVFHVDKRELDLLAKQLDTWDHSKLKIPILLMADTNYEDGRWKVIGRTEVKVVSKLIEREPEKEDEMLIFYPQLHHLRKTLPTTTNVMYMP